MGIEMSGKNNIGLFGNWEKKKKSAQNLTCCSCYAAFSLLFKRGTNGSRVDFSLRTFLLPLTTRSGVLGGQIFAVADGHLPFPAVKLSNISDIPAQVERVQELEAVGTFRHV